MLIAVGPWIWRDTGAGEAWTPPPACLGALDLRSLAQCAERGGPPYGAGVFELTEHPGPGYVVLGTDYHDTISEATAVALAALLWQPGLHAMPVVDLLWSLVTDRSDPSQETFSGSVMPHAPGRLRLTLGTLDVERETAVGGFGWPKIQETYQRIYRAVLADVMAGRAPVGANQRLLPFFMAAMQNPDYRLFIPSDLPVVPPLTPTTTISDDFNRADSNPMSNAAAGWAWVLAGGSGNWQTFFHLCNMSLAAQDHVIRAESSLSGVDMYTKATAAAGSGGFFGVAVRMNSASENGYVGLATWTGGNDCRISKMVAGTRSDLGAAGAGAPFALGDTIKCSVSGSALALVKNTGASVRTVTDTTFASGSRGGMWQFSGGVTLNYFEAADTGAVGYILTADPGSYAVTGTAAVLRARRAVLVASGAVTCTGSGATLRVGRRLTAGSGAVSVIGTDATLTKSTAALSYTLTAGSGTYAATGTAASLRLGRGLFAGSGAVTVTGTAVQCRVTRAITVGTGVYTLTGSPVTLRFGTGAVVPGELLTADLSLCTGLTMTMALQTALTTTTAR